MYNTLHSIAPGSGSICSWPERVPEGREYCGCFSGTRSGVTGRPFSRLSGIYHLLKSCQQHYFTDVTDTPAVSMAMSELVERMTVTLASSGHESNSDNIHIQLPNWLASVNNYYSAVVSEDVSSRELGNGEGGRGVCGAKI